MGPALARLAGAIARAPRRAALLWLLGFLLVASGASRLSVDFSSRGFFGAHSPEARALDAFQQRWGPDDADLIVLATAGDVTAPPAVEEIHRVAQILEGLPQVASVLDPTRVPLGGATGRSLRDGGWPPGTPAPAIVPALVARDRSALAIVAHLHVSSDDLGAVVPAVEAIRAALPTTHAVELELAGVPAIRAAFFALVMRDQARFIPATLAIIGVLLWVAFRRMHGVVVPAVAAFAPLVLLLGFMGWTGASVGLLNQAFFTLIPVVAVADAVHVVERVHQERRAAPELETPAILGAAMGKVGLACFMTSMTTAIGFASLALADMPVLRAFGLHAAAGMAFAFVTVITLVPALLAMSDLDPSPRTESRLARLADPIHRGRWAIRALGLVVLAGATLIARDVPVDNRLVDLLRADHPVAQASATVDASLGGTLGLEVELAAAPGELLTGQGLAFLERLEAHLASEEDMRSVLGPATTLRTIHGALPGSPALVRGTLTLAQAGGLPTTVTADETRVRVSARSADRGGRAFLALSNRTAAWLDANTPPGVDALVTGTPRLAYAGVNRITAELRDSLLLAFVVIVGITAVMLRSLPLALAAIVPNALPLAVAYAAVGTLVGTLDPLGTVILVLGLGIAVDDSIHILARYREERSAGHSPNLAVRAALAHTGRALTITTAAVVGGLAIMLGSAFPPLALLGSLGSVTLATAWVADVILLPALLMRAR